MKKLLALKVVMVLGLIAISASTALGTIPNAPTNLTGTVSGPTGITLGWTDNSSDETSFRIERSTDGVQFAPLFTVASDVTTSVDATVSTDVYYYYRLFAVNADGDSAPSNVAKLTIDTIAPPAPTPSMPPNGDQLDTHNVQYQWSPVSDMTGVKYRIVVNDLANGITLHDISGITSNNITLLCYDSVYEWYVYAYDGAGNVSLVSASSYCTVVAFDHMAPDTVVTAPNGGEVLEADSYFAITWYNLDQDFTSTPDLKIRIYFSYNNGKNWEEIVSLGDNPGAFNWHVPNVQCYETCLIRVTAENIAGMFGSDDSDYAFSIVYSPHISVSDSISPRHDHHVPFGNITEEINSSTQEIAIRNEGYIALTVSSIELTGSDASEFSLDLDGGLQPCGIALPWTVEAGAYCTATVTFAPLSAGSKSAHIDITSDDSHNSSVSISLDGTGMSSVANNAPSAPVLLSPTDSQTGLGTDITLTWKKSEDPDGDAISYRVHYCTDPTFSSCTPDTVANFGAPKAFYATAGSGLLLMGAIFAIPRSERKKLILLVIALIMIGGVVGACSRGGSGDAAPAPAPSLEMSHQMSGLPAGTTYYWKVVADDGKGGIVESAVWSFTTQ